MSTLLLAGVIMAAWVLIGTLGAMFFAAVLHRFGAYDYADERQARELSARRHTPLNNEAPAAAHGRRS
jgi:hypothetical protein